MRGCICFVTYVIASALACTLVVQAQRIRGTPGIDYPNYHTIPKTSFKCSEQKYMPGFYADLETDCQVFHFCFSSRQESFLCPTGTTFNQPILACDNWYSSNCSLAQLFYVVNAGPGIQNAGKNIPMLLKLKKRAQGIVSTEPSMTTEVSSLDESIVEHEKQSKDAPENAKLETLMNDQSANDKNESEIVPDKASSNVENESQFYENTNSNSGGDKSAGHFESDGKESHEISDYIDKNTSLSEEQLNSEQTETDFVYDPVTDAYYTRGNDPSDTEWQDESEPQNKVQSFYDYVSNDFSNQMMQDDESRDPGQNFYEYRSNDFDNEIRDDETVQFEDGYVNDEYSDGAAEYSEVQTENAMERSALDDASDDVNGHEFSRYFPQSQIPKRSRRRPTYVVIDESENRLRSSQYSDVDSTESPFAESISIDTLVELNTQLPMEYAEEEIDSEIAGMTGNLNENAEENYKEIPGFENAYSKEESSNTDADFTFEGTNLGNLDRNGNFETSKADSRSLSSENEQSLYDGGENLEEGMDFKGENQSVNSEADFTEHGYQSDSGDAEEVKETEPDEEIQIYDDSTITDEESAQNVAHGMPVEQELDDTFVVIPDETDSVSTTENILDSLSLGEKEIDNSFVVIPDETDNVVTTDSSDFQYPDEDSVYDSASDSMNQNLDYSEVDGSRNVDSANTGYVYEDMNDSEQQTDFSEGDGYEYREIGASDPRREGFEGVSYVYEDANESDQTDSEGTRYIYEDINAGEQMRGVQSDGYAYSDSPGGRDSHEYDLITDPEVQQFPGNYYRYMSESQESMNPRYQDPGVSYVMSDGTEIENPAVSEYAPREDLPGVRYDANGNMFSYGISSADWSSYGYAQPGIQQAGYLNPYNPGFGYSYGNPHDGEYPGAIENQSGVSASGSVEADYLNQAPESEVQYGPMYSELPESRDRYSTEEYEAIKDETKVDFSLRSDKEENNFASSSDEVLDADIYSDQNSNFEDAGSIEEFDGQTDERHYDESTTGEPFEESKRHSIDMDAEFKANAIYPIGVSQIDEWKEPSDLKERASPHETYSSPSDENSEGTKSNTSDKFKSTEQSNEPSGEDSSKEKFKEHLISEPEIGLDAQSDKQPLDAWLSQGFPNMNVKAPVSTQSAQRLAERKRAKEQRTDFNSPTETQFLNPMSFPNSMDFGPFSFGSNVGQQYGMMDSTSTIPKIRSKTGNKLSGGILKPDDSSQLSKLSSLQEKVRSMKRGKFGMFKKYMNSIKNQNEINI